jgi:hypothetical protein
MPKKLAADLPDQVAAEISRHPLGISKSELDQRLGNEVSPRSLGRILNALVRRQRIRLTGATRAARYTVAPPPNQPGLDRASAHGALLAMQPEPESYVPLTGDSETLRSLIKRPIMQRKPVGYDRGLLGAYVPNETFYLNDADLRSQLAFIGGMSLAQRPVGSYARDILGRLLIDLSWASSRLEGNTYTRLDTVRLIEHSLAAEGKDFVETQMILNHKQAIEFLIEERENIGIDMHTLLSLHGLLSENLLASPDMEGQLRTGIVEVSGSVYRPLAVPQQIEELFRLILKKAAAIHDPIEQAFFLMVHIPYLQPFIDVNKRLSRLAANIPLIQSHLFPLSFVGVPERAYVEGTLAIYENGRVDLLRDVFIWAYERSCEQFKAIAEALPEPNLFRMKYRAALVEVVGDIVRAGLPIDTTAIRPLAIKLVPGEDLPRFLKMALDELRGLHEGNIARHRLRLAEFSAWKERQS